MAELWNIGEMAKRAGVKPSTLRYYEAQGIFLPAKRAGSGYRKYTPDQLAILRFILEAKQLGLSLRQIRWVLQTAGQQGSPCEQVELLLRKAVARLNERIARLRARRDALAYALQSVTHPGGESPCVLLAQAIEFYRRCSTMARTIEVFTAGCSLCDEIILRVKQAVAQCGCTVITRSPDSPEAQRYGVRAVPAIAVDGHIIFTGVPTQEQADALLSR